MSGIAGFSGFSMNYMNQREKWSSILYKMNEVQRHRGPDGTGIYVEEHCGLGQVRLAVIDLETGQQPMMRTIGNKRCAITYNGEVYNMLSLKEELQREGMEFQTTSDTEVVLLGYMLHGIEYIKKLNGVFAFAIWDEALQRLFLVRDRAGVKPLFYKIQDNMLVFSSELKGILAFPDVEAVVDKEGLCEIFGLGPAKTYGKGVFKDILEIKSGYYMEYSKDNIKEHCYWSLESAPHTDSYEETVDKVEFLVRDAIQMQMLSDVPICTFLSGGVDSSLITAICSQELQKKGKVLDTYSFDFINNNINFKANSFQPSEDRPWVDKMTEFTKSNHQYLECNNEDLYEYLFQAVDARDLPCMADVEASMLYFCGKVAKHNKVTLTGEGADEIFGGYPWFHKKECFEADCFPWSMDFGPRTMLLKDEVLRELPLEEYAKAAYQKTIFETPTLYGEAPVEKRRREIAYLNLKWFMQTLLDRMDRTSMHVGLEARVPFADYRIMEYVWNVPWDMKCHNGIVKGLLRAAGEKHLPNDVLYRKKSPYPKTYDPKYEALVKTKIREVLENSNAPLCTLIDAKKVEGYLESKLDYGRPFYGQLMAGPQLLAYMLQVNYWLERYHISV